MYTINFIHGDTIKNIPDKTTLIDVWTQELFHNVGNAYKIFDDDNIILNKEMDPEDIKILEQLPDPAGDCSCGACPVVL